VAHVIHLANGDLSLDLDPALGMLATSLRFRDDQLLAPARARREEVVRVDTLRGMALLAPWANRLPGDRYEAEGRAVDLTALPIERDAQGRPLHGTITGRGAWVVLEERSDVVVAALDLFEDPITATAFPFSARIQVEWRLTGDALEVTTALVATDRGLVPACFGWHPYLVLPDADRGACRVRIPGGEAAPIGDATVDTLVTVGEARSATLTGARRTLTLTLGPGYGWLQVWMPAGEPFISLEPMAAPTGALAAGGYPVARPGAPHRASFRLGVRGSD
jgi:galactose mutarotase-like enzyme